MNHIIKKFIKETLGCKCPDDVFEHIELERNVQLYGDVSLYAKINIGNRLLVYVLEADSCSFVQENVPVVLFYGREERDRKGFNRFRLVLAGEKINQCEQTAFRTFQHAGQRDERTHLHLIKDIFRELHR